MIFNGSAYGSTLEKGAEPIPKHLVVANPALEGHIRKVRFSQEYSLLIIEPPFVYSVFLNLNPQPCTFCKTSSDLACDFNVKAVGRHIVRRN